MATMLDVAKHANVALSTVSYAINGTRPISEETRQRIFAASAELGYQPHALARGLASKRSKIVALLFPAPERGLGFTELEFVTSAADAARENGYSLVLWSSKMDDLNDLRQLTQQGLVEGVIMMEVRLNDVRIDLLRASTLPFSMIGRSGDTQGMSYADIDFDQTTREAVNHLAGLDHTQIAFLNHSQSEFAAGYGPSVRADAGFNRAIEEAGLRGVTWLCQDSPHAGHAAFNALLAEHPGVTAFVVMNERALPGVMQAIAERDWRIPDDFSLVSIVSSARVAEMMVPPLTTLEPPSSELGKLGVELLIQQLETEVQDAPQKLLPCRLVTRGSTGPCPQHRRAQTS